MGWMRPAISAVDGCHSRRCRKECTQLPALRSEKTLRMSAAVMDWLNMVRRQQAAAAAVVPDAQTMSTRARVTARGNVSASSRASAELAHEQQIERYVPLAWWRSASWSTGRFAVSGVAEALAQPQFEQVPMSASDAVKLTNGKPSTRTVAIREATAVMTRLMRACASASPPSAARSGSRIAGDLGTRGHLRGRRVAELVDPGE
jgi:hypothetical protein